MCYSVAIAKLTHSFIRLAGLPNMYTERKRILSPLYFPSLTDEYALVKRTTRVPVNDTEKKYSSIITIITVALLEIIGMTVYDSLSSRHRRRRHSPLSNCVYHSQHMIKFRLSLIHKKALFFLVCEIARVLFTVSAVFRCLLLSEFYFSASLWREFFMKKYSFRFLCLFDLETSRRNKKLHVCRVRV